MPTPRAFTAEEARNEIMDYVRKVAAQAAETVGRTDREKCDMVAFSILCMLDGVVAVPHLPAMDLVLRPHPDDKEYCIGKGENWYEDGMVVNDCELHALYYE